ncbi:hypothetical protein ACF09J_30505 [Streptomyces sp. NPDC014889]|uniref:hypothetical protein n=1 Tax=Streptomyces sp. NPDC014889 TaxID=3364928 RepID=UPI0036FA4B11
MLARNPYGLGGRMRPEDAAEFQQRQIADCDLAAGVAAGTRDFFQRLRTVFAYGVLSWNTSGRTRMEPAGALTASDPMEDQEGDEYQHVVVRAIPFNPGSRWNDAHRAESDTRYETTRFPTDYLWGPGTRAEARAWLEHERPETDSVDFTDRVFLAETVRAMPAGADGHAHLMLLPSGSLIRRRGDIRR